MYRKPPFFVLALAGGVLIGALGASMWPAKAPRPGDSQGGPADLSHRLSSDPSRATDPERLADVVESLTQVLNDEINERRVLGEQLAQLASDVSDLKQNLRARVQEAFRVENQITDTQAEPAIEGSPQERYAAVGITPQQLQSIERLQAEAQMAAIDLDDRARREGWYNTPRYFQEAREVASGATAIRSMLGDDSYDRYLFASGMPNRLTVGAVIQSSPAQAAGFQRGDVIVRYAGERVFSNDQLVGLRSSGVRGEPVAVEILRDGRRLQLTMPRGPMGIAGAPTVADPDAAQD